MSFLICHMEKYTAGAVRGLQIHNYRQKESRTNPDIDNSKSDLNIYDSPQKNVNYNAVIKERLQDLNLKKAVRKDAIVMTQFVITSDTNFFKNLSREQQINFFEDARDFFNDRYGLHNAIDSAIHFDERTPHMHISFVPVTDDGRLSAKSIFTPAHLRDLQTQIFEQVGKKYGLERGVEGSKAQHIETAKLKLDTLQKKHGTFLAVKKRAEEAEKKVNDISCRIDETLEIMGKPIETEFNKIYAKLKARDEQVQAPKISKKTQSLDILP